MTLRDAGSITPSTGGRLAWAEHGAGPPLVLIHGVMISGDMFEPVVETLAARHRLIVPDLRGHGRSRSLPPPYTVTQLAADLAALVDDLGLTSVDVLGYSQGGAVAQQFACDHPDRCRRLVLACTYAYNMATLRERVEGRAAPLLLRLLGMKRFARLIVAVGLRRVDPTRAAWVTRLIGGQDRRRMIQAWRAAMAFDGRRRLAEIRCPTLVIAGGQDAAVPMHHARQLHAGIAGSRLAVVDGADHALVWSHPAELVRLTEDFLRD
jgi:3-oxoadipate enol-lactonase